MDAWQLWQDMARESEEAARMAEVGGCLRSAASHYYYAAYQAVTALLLYRGLTPPLDREAWSHEETPALLQDQLRTLIRSRDRRNDLATRLKQLYRRRLTADYQSAKTVTAAQVIKAGQDARFILRVVDEKLPRRH
jgi:uncharacterized protein (UPF0332 family)